MKFYLKPIFSVIALAILLGYSGCKKGGDPTPSVQDQQLAKLKATWKVGAGDDVRLDDSSVKSDYDAFTITITGNPGETTFGYTTSGRPALSPWPASGTWEFGSDPATQITRDKGTSQVLAINYSVTDTQLELTFNYTGPGESGSGKVTGSWVMTLTKQ